MRCPDIIMPFPIDISSSVLFGEGAQQEKSIFSLVGREVGRGP